MLCTQQFTPEQCAVLADLLTANNQSFDPDIAHSVFISCLQMWAIGLAVGIIFSLIRKLK
jgi:hypothetical protein